MPYVAPTAVVSGATISKSTFGDVVIADLNFLANTPACRVYNNAAISAANNANTFLTFNTERHDTDSMHSTSTNTGRITFTTAGVYVVTGHVSIAVNATGIRETFIRLNGATFIAKQGTVGYAGDDAHLSVTTIYKFAAADYVELGVYQNSGGALNVVAAGNSTPEFAAQWVALG